MTAEEVKANRIKLGPGEAAWWCKKCDSIARFLAIRDDRDVNKAMDQSKLFCVNRSN